MTTTKDTVHDGDNPENFGENPPADLEVLSDREKELVSGGHSISGAQQTVESEGGESTNVFEKLTEEGEGK